MGDDLEHVNDLAQESRGEAPTGQRCHTVSIKEGNSNVRKRIKCINSDFNIILKNSDSNWSP